MEWSVQIKAANLTRWTDVMERGGIVLARRSPLPTYAQARRERKAMARLYPAARLRVRPTRAVR